MQAVHSAVENGFERSDEDKDKEPKQKYDEYLLDERFVQEDDYRLTQRNAYLASLFATSLELMNRLDIDSLLESVITHACKLTGTTHSFLGLIEKNSNIISVKIGTGMYSEKIGLQVMLGEGVSGRVCQTGQSLIINAYHQLNDLLPDFDCPQMKSIVCVPLKSYENIFGAIGIAFSECEHVCNQEELEFLEGFASLVSIALGNARLYESVQYELKERELIEQQLKYISMHDSLTGLYNRAYFEEEMKRLNSGRFDPVAIVVCDVDGLKLVNDTLGHTSGDELLKEAAKMISASFRDNDMIARIGGDEFVALLPQCDEKALQEICIRIMNAVTAYNKNKTDFLLSISVGFSCKYAADDITHVFKDADDSMYREKLRRRPSTHIHLIQKLKSILEHRDFIAQGHADRLTRLVSALAKRIGLSGERLHNLALLAQFHDIGKVGIPDIIINKDGPLTYEEYAEVKKHSEIGYRIAQSLPEMAMIAEFILKHHEWWNGTGYPFGLSGEQIPIECRIMAIADAYDVMTSERPYQLAKSHDAAMTEIKKYAGTQFDPHLVEEFIKMVKENFA